jgi:hypothetical protein
LTRVPSTGATAFFFQGDPELGDLSGDHCRYNAGMLVILRAATGGPWQS